MNRFVFSCAAIVVLITSLLNSQQTRGDEKELPQGLSEYIASLARLQNATFDYESFSVSAKDKVEKPLGTPVTQFEYGKVQLDFSSRDYKIEKFMRSSSEETFHLQRIMSHVDGVTTIISEDMGKANSRKAVIGGNSQHFSPFNMLGFGFALSNDLGFDPDEIRHLSDFLIDEEHMGVGPSDGVTNSYVVKSIGSKRRFQNPLRYDLRIDLDPSRNFFPNRVSLYSRSHDDANYEKPYKVYTVRKFGSSDQAFFPLSVHRQIGTEELGTENLWTIVEGSLQLNIAPSMLNCGVDLNGIPGYDHRTKSRFNQTENLPSSAEGPFANVRRSTDEATAAKLNSSRFSTSRFAMISFGLLLLACGVWLIVDRWRNGAGKLLGGVALLAILPIGCGRESAEQVGERAAVPDFSPITDLPISVRFERDESRHSVKTATVTYRNNSSKTVEISEPATSCGCTSARWSRLIVPPGEITMLTAEIEPPRVGSPKLVSVNTRVVCEGQVDQILVPIVVSYDLDWDVEGTTPIRGPLGERGVGEVTVIVSPDAPPPKLTIESDLDVSFVGPAMPVKNDSRRWIYGITAIVREPGRVPVGRIRFVAESGMFPLSSEIEVITDGKYPGSWSERILIARSDEANVRFNCEPDWRLVDVRSTDDRVTASIRPRNDGVSESDVIVRWEVRPSEAVTLHAALSNKQRQVLVPLKVIFPGSRQ